jgi:hypothetical protein
MPVQSEMLATVAQWAEKQKPKIFERLTKQAVRNHENIRLAGEGGAPEAVGGFAQTQGLDMQNKIGGYLQGAVSIIYYLYIAANIDEYSDRFLERAPS